MRDLKGLRSEVDALRAAQEELHRNTRDLKALQDSHDKHGKDLETLRASHEQLLSLPERLEFLSSQGEKQILELEALRAAHQMRDAAQSKHARDPEALKAAPAE